MGMELVILSIATFIGLYMAANIGANDLANAMGTSVGSRALALKQAVLLSAVADVLGACDQHDQQGNNFPKSLGSRA
jgi:PiT family inorganic phosphate transporter